MTVGDQVRLESDEALAKLFTDICISSNNRILAAAGMPEDAEKHREEFFKEWLELMKKEVEL